jgi:PAS domain S-box-containing protein
LARSFEPVLPSTARVLLVDDAPDHVRLIRAILERPRTPRFEVFSSGDPDDAIRRIRSEPFDAILLDYRLPGRSGLEILKTINRDRRYPVIILTGQGDERTAVEFFHAGAYDYVSKTEGRNLSESLLRALRDLLRHRAMEAELSRERERARAVLESQPTMVCCLDRELRIRETNRPFRRFFQAWRHPERGEGEPEDPAGIVWPDQIDDPGLRERMIENLRAVLDGSKPYQDEVEITAGGVPCIFWLLASPLRVGGATAGIVLTYTDLTEQRLANRLQLRLARAVDSSMDGVVITDTRGRIEYFNPAFARMTGYRPEDLHARRTRPPQISPTRTDLAPMVREKLARGEEWQGEVVNRRKDGSLYFADMTVSHIRDDAGQLVGFVSTERDVTERKVFTDELIKAREVAEESLRAKDKFLATVSHELRTPLTSIIGFADLLLLEPGLPGHCHAFAESIMRGGRHLKRLIDNILDLSRFAGGRFYLDLEPLGLRSVLEEALEMVRAEAEAKGIACELEIDPRLPGAAVIDRMKIQQVLLNLLSNAVKYSGGGRVRLTAGPLFTEAGALAGEKPRMLLFSVSDQGPGIPADQQRRIFEEFVQLEDGAQRRRSGTGLGLSISQRLVRLMGGTIWVDSRPDEGARFTFTLPLVVPDAAAPTHAAGGRAGRAGGPCLLLHRNHPGAIPGEAELGDWGYRLAITTTAEELRQAAGEDDPFACVVYSAVEIASSLIQIAQGAAIAAGRVVWFLIGRTADGEAVPLGRVIPLGEMTGPRAVSRLMRALGSLPAGSRRVVVDSHDAETAAWVRGAMGGTEIPLWTIDPEGRAPEFDPDDGVVLVLDLSRSALRGFEVWRSLADRVPRLHVALRHPASCDPGWIERVDSSWARIAESFTSRAPQRLRWMLNAVHTTASQSRMGMGGLLAEDPVAGREAPGPLPRPSGPILVVEDNPENRDLIRRMIDSFDLPSCVAGDGAEALAVAARNRPSVVLMDLEMPGMDGCEATRAFHRLGGCDHLPIIAMTAHVGPEDRRRCHEAGCIDFLPKPIERGDLLRVLHRWLGRSGAHPLEEHTPIAPAEDSPLSR